MVEKAESHESTRQRAEFVQSKNHEDHVAGKGCTSISHYDLVHKFIPMPQAMKISGSESSGRQGMGKIGENFGVELDESQK